LIEPTSGPKIFSAIACNVSTGDGAVGSLIIVDNPHVGSSTGSADNFLKLPSCQDTVVVPVHVHCLVLCNCVDKGHSCCSCVKAIHPTCRLAGDTAGSIGFGEDELIAGSAVIRHVIAFFHSTGLSNIVCDPLRMVPDRAIPM
jgi:hypothetical protein